MADDIDLDFVTLKEATAICRFKTTRPIQNAIKNREITPYRVNPHHILIAKTELVRWLVQHRGRPVKSRKNGDKK